MRKLLFLLMVLGAVSISSCSMYGYQQGYQQYQQPIYRYQQQYNYSTPYSGPAVITWGLGIPNYQYQPMVLPRYNNNYYYQQPAQPRYYYYRR